MSWSRSTASYNDFLPAANFVLYPSDNIILRAAVAKVITRPSLGNLTPGGSADGFNLRVSFGNPFLNPFRAWAYDLGFEWYFAPQSIFSVALFRKEISSFPIALNTTGSFDSTGLPVSVLVSSSPAALNPAIRAATNWTISTIINGSGANLNGVEVAIQGPFKFLPGLLVQFRRHPERHLRQFERHLYGAGAVGGAGRGQRLGPAQRHLVRPLEMGRERHALL